MLAEKVVQQWFNSEYAWVRSKHQHRPLAGLYKEAGAGRTDDLITFPKCLFIIYCARGSGLKIS